MRQFIKKTLFTLLMAVGVSIVFIGITYRQRATILNYKIPADKHIVVMGNSQTEMGINDEGIDGLIKLSKSAKQYLFMRIDLENLFKLNSQIDTVFLVVSPFSTRKTDADRSYYDNALARSITYYAPYLRSDDWKSLPERREFAKDLISGSCLKYLIQQQKCGAYLYNTRDDMEADKQKTERDRGLKEEKQGNFITISQLDAIGNLCKANKVKLIYISTPGYNSTINYDLSYFREQVAELQKRHDADYWNFVDIQLADTCFSDMTHLNWKGAIQFTEIFKKRLGR